MSHARVDPPVTRDNICECQCHRDDIGLCEQCCESGTAWNAALDAVIKAHDDADTYDWDRALILSLKR